ncbi:MAG: F0F1 ATP synthase subunit B [Chloroflexi bacterium]|nr:F0F1 ATP synthase subunit B [Chloroflexota bacterium]MCL5274842.1 F0F1 ATP synthase subunit B [Chloroflexota bacterium]
MLLPAITQVMAEGGGDAFSGLGINAFLLIAQIVNFVFLILFLNGLIIKPILKGLENRRARIEESLENARKADERLANVERDYQARLSEATIEAQKLRAEAMQNTQAEVERIRKDAQGEAEHIKQQARIDAIAERNQMLAGLRSQVGALAMAAANKIIGDSLDAQRQRVLIDDFFARVPATLLSGVEISGPASVNVTSALPLSADEQAAVKADLGRQVGQLGEVTFDVDPTIMGGLVVRVGDKIVDGSVNGKLTALRQSLNA